MLYLTRRVHEAIDIILEDDRRITVLLHKVHGGQVTFGIDAPRTIVVDRREVTKRKKLGAARDTVMSGP